MEEEEESGEEVLQQLPWDERDAEQQWSSLYRMGHGREEEQVQELLGSDFDTDFEEEVGDQPSLRPPQLPLPPPAPLPHLPFPQLPLPPPAPLPDLPFSQLPPPALLPQLPPPELPLSPPQPPQLPPPPLEQEQGLQFVAQAYMQLMEGPGLEDLPPQAHHSSFRGGKGMCL